MFSVLPIAKTSGVTCQRRMASHYLDLIQFVSNMSILP